MTAPIPEPYTIAQSSQLLKAALAPLAQYIEELRCANESTSPNRDLTPTLNTAGHASDHMKMALKLIKELTSPNNAPARPHAFYFPCWNQGGMTLHLKDQDDVTTLHIPQSHEWTGYRPLAFALLENHQGREYAMLWHDTFADNILSKLPQPHWQLSWTDVQTWTALHDWRGHHP